MNQRLIDKDKLLEDILKGIEDAPLYIQATVEQYICEAPVIALLEPNDPLTLEQMREMGGEPYWHVGLQEDSVPPHWNILDPFYAKHIEDYGYGKRWIAYRRKPEEVRYSGG